MPESSKNARKNQCLTTVDNMIVSVIPDLDSHSKLYGSCGELLTKLFPVKLHNTGITCSVDNWYTSRESVEFLIKLKVRFIGTLKKNRLGPFFGAVVQDVFDYKAQRNEEFRRRMYVYRHVLSGTAIDIIAYYDKKKVPPVIFVTNCQNLFQDYSNLPHQTQYLPGQTQPSFVLFYNFTMGGVDDADWSMNKWSLSFRSQNSKNEWSHFSKRQLTNFLDIVLHNLFILTKKHKIANNETISKSFRHDWQVQLALDFFIKKPRAPTIPNDPRPLTEIQNLITVNSAKKT